MKRNLFLVCVAAIFAACNSQTTNKLTVEGEVSDYSTKNLYLYNVYNQQYDMLVPIDTIVVGNDGRFSYTNDTLQTQLYFLSTTHQVSMDLLKEGAYVFLQKGENELSIHQNERTQMAIDNGSFEVQEELNDFSEKMYRASNGAVIDSLDQLFFAARDAGDDAEMARIREASTPYYEKADADAEAFLEKTIEGQKQSFFGLYLYYTYYFQNRSFATADETNAVRERLKGVDEMARQSVYYKRIEEKLTRIENCAVGSKAPEIVGLDSLDNEVHLSDFRGKYVLVDFWSSGCSWCRKETPNFRKTFEAFDGDNFAILGVSSDYEKEEWLRAINEDKSHWNQIMMRKSDINRIMNEYVIVGIPEIFLVNPEGVIVAKGLRGEAIYNAVAEHLK